jgi:hypothetical protein
MTNFATPPPVDIKVDGKVIATVLPGGCPIEDAARLEAILRPQAASAF